MDARQRFSITVDDYARYRPGYPPRLYDELIAATALAAGATVVDVGCGTGLSTRPWHERGMVAVGVEPNDEMRTAAVAAGGGPRYVAGDAAHTTLADASADLVCAAQAFHWFPVDETLVEWRRILRPGGAASAYWNLRAKTPFMQEYEALLATLGEYHNVPKGRPTLERLAMHPELTVVATLSVPNHQRFDREALLGRARSSSYVAHSPAERERLTTELVALHARFADADGHVDFAYETVALVWRFLSR